MSTKKLGNIHLSDYLAITGKWDRRPPSLRWLLLTPLLCVAFFTAGVYAPWSGKYSSKLSMEEALAILHQAPSEVWERELGVGAVHRQVEKALFVLKEVAKGDDQPSLDASLSLGHLAYQCLTSILELSAEPTHENTHRASLARAQKLLRN